jgi:alkylation response protein AidB-like acyl-CoA dehydrogenase
MTRDQDTLARTREFVRTQLVPYVQRNDHGLESHRRLHQAAGQVGLLGLQVPPAQGGLGISFRCKAQVADLLAAADFGVAMSLINTHNVAEQLVRLGQPALAQRYLTDLMAGRLIACTALTESTAGSDFSAIRSFATPVAGGWRLDGDKTWITNAVHADLVVVYAQTAVGAKGRGIAAFLVDTRRAGFQRSSVDPMGPVASIAAGGFSLQGYVCTDNEMVSPPGQAFNDILGAINGARTYVAAMCCGMVEDALQTVNRWGAVRTAFGGPLHSHQGWRWGLADAANDLEAARALVDQAAALIDAGADAQSASAHAKVFATRMARKHIAALMHAMGAEGLGADYPFTRHLAAAQLAGLVDGSTEMLLERIAKDLAAQATRSAPE